MNEEIKEMLDRLEYYKDDIYYVGFVDGINIGNTFLPKDVKLLLNYITNLQEENYKLKETNEEHCKINGELRKENQELKQWDYNKDTRDECFRLLKENQKLVKVIDELEEWLNKYFVGTMSDTVLNKLTELKGGNNDEI